MPEEVLFKTERRQSRADVAAYLRTVAEKLEAGEKMTLAAGDQSVSLAVPAQPTFEVKAERETSSGGGPAELSVEFELEWDEGADQSGSSGTLEIE
ncbi:amphi-Trp domain-containing protein [Halorussus halophilus]|uniref:amphi-Trp domain-containing protein n=1 Tax=Halorussus halophilus TaxID=2650975 RepID=UPI001300FF47|nr:amphi-Trp domain-containing protein [Halorussus halophilus]